MIKDRLILPDGRQISSGEQVSIQSLSYRKKINAEENFSPGCACCAQLDIKLLDETGSFSIAPGTEIAYYRGEKFMGTFYTEKATRPGRYLLSFTAYDAMVKAETDLTAWLAALPGWPYTIQSLLELVCEECGIALDPEISLCNAEFPVLQFAKQVTGRQLIGWAAQAQGAYAHIDGQGQLTFSYFAEGPTPITLGDCKGLTLAESPCAPIESVAIGQSENDLLAVWPENGGGECLRITANPLLAAFSQETLTACAKNIYDRLAGFTYTPLEAEVFADCEEIPWLPGQLVQVEGKVCALFSLELSGAGAKLKSTGTASRESASARYSRDKVEIVQGQMARVEEKITGITTQVGKVTAQLDENETLLLNTREEISQLQVESDRISAQVSQTETAAQADLQLVQTDMQTLKKQVELTVTEEQMALEISKALEQGAQKVVTRTGYTFDENGLTIATDRSDIRNLLDHTGMEVTRGEEILLRADNTGVTARDVTVHNYLVIGSHARLEDYPNSRTACFWL